jgi:hypothetical protein
MVSNLPSIPHLESTPASPENIIRTPWAVISLAAVCLLWAGMVLGISVLEAPVKFQAPTLTREVGMDVGRTVFSAFNKVEIGWSLLSFWLFIIVRPFHRAPRVLRVLLPLLWLVVLLQSVFLLPALVQRALLVMHGQPLPASPIHALYSSSELIKLLSLIACGVLVLRALLNSSPLSSRSS